MLALAVATLICQKRLTIAPNPNLRISSRSLHFLHFSSTERPLSAISSSDVGETLSHPCRRAKVVGILEKAAKQNPGQKRTGRRGRKEGLTLRSLEISFVPTDHTGHQDNQESLLPRNCPHESIVEVALRSTILEVSFPSSRY